MSKVNQTKKGKKYYLPNPLYIQYEQEWRKAEMGWQFRGDDFNLLTRDEYIKARNKKVSFDDFIKLKNIEKEIERPPTIQEQQEQTYEDILSELAIYQDEENRRFYDLQEEARKRDETRTQEYESLMSDFSTKLADADTERKKQYTSFMSQLTESFQEAEKVRISEQSKFSADIASQFQEAEKKRILEQGKFSADIASQFQEAEKKRISEQSKFSADIASQFRTAEKVRKDEQLALEEKQRIEKEKMEKEATEKRTLLENTTAQQIQRMRLRGTGGRKPTIKTSNIGLTMTGLLGSPQAIGL